MLRNHSFSSDTINRGFFPKPGVEPDSSIFKVTNHPVFPTIAVPEVAAPLTWSSQTKERG
jgi:hypothetical protein